MRPESFTDNHAEEMALGDVARAVHMSTFYFCKTFKKATGFTFTDYLSRVRIEKARRLLLNPNVCISEVAFEAGFQSLTHFNRTFHRLLGESPTEYRAALAKSVRSSVRHHFAIHDFALRTAEGWQNHGWQNHWMAECSL